MQLGTLQISLNLSTIRGHTSEVRTVIYIGCSILQMAFPNSRTMPCTKLFPTQKSIPKTQIIPHWEDI